MRTDADTTSENRTKPNDDILSYDAYSKVLLLGEADFSFSRAFASKFNTRAQTLCVTASEYGDCCDVANRYYNASQQDLTASMMSLTNLHPVKEIICGLNCREISDPACACQRWNPDSNEWDSNSMFWDEDKDQMFDLIIFNFPHSSQAGRAGKLVRALFKQTRLCIKEGKLPKNVVLEMRLRFIEVDPFRKKNIRSFYNHEQAAKENGFELIGSWAGDLEHWESLGYRHKMTKKNESCRDINVGSKVWRWSYAQYV